MADSKIYALVDYEDKYVQPLLLSALKEHLPSDLLVLIEDISELPSPESRFLQWRQYESIDFDQVLAHPTSSLANSYVIRKALIRKHYLSTTVAHWLTKNPASVLQDHVKPSVELEVDYAEFLDDALVEAYELKESFTRNSYRGEGDEEREWWILKPGMSDRGQGIRLFSSEEELQAIFEAWDPPEDEDGEEGEQEGNGVIASQLRHFIAQPYVHPPLLLPGSHPSGGRKFHIRTYVLARGALKVFVYRPMLALFAGKAYTAPSTSTDPNEDLSRHLTNTCLQSGEREGSVHDFWSLALPNKDAIFDQICSITGETFEAAAKTMGIHFQPVPNSFEIFGVDYLVDKEGTAWLLEVNAFPDFAQTGDELKKLIGGLFEEVVEQGVKPFFEVGGDRSGDSERLRKVLDVDLGRR